MDPQPPNENKPPPKKKKSVVPPAPKADAVAKAGESPISRTEEAVKLTQTGSKRHWPLIVAVASGFFFAVVMLVVAFAIPDPTIFQFFVFRVILAFAAGGLGAAIPGFLEIRISPYKKGWIHAGGAIAFAVLIYQFNPPPLIAPPPTGKALQQFADPPGAASKWIEQMKQAKDNGTLYSLAATPTSVLAARARFEEWWLETPISQKKKLDPAMVSEALSLNIWLCRKEEIDNPHKPSSLKWADQAIAFFEESANKNYIVESLLEKAAIFLDLSDISHTDPNLFQRVASDGDQLMRRASSLAAQMQKAKVFRLWSRFYYNLARPRSGNLNADWDNNYLIVAYEKIQMAATLQPEELKNITQLARVTMKVAANNQQDNAPLWTTRLREAQTLLRERWKVESAIISEPRSRVSPLNVLAVITMEAVKREWLEATAVERTNKFSGWLEELSSVAVRSMAETIVLVKGTELEEKYDYDLYYDLARIYAVRVIILDYFASPLADQDFKLALLNLNEAKGGATDLQRQAALGSLGKEPCFTNLSAERMKMVRSVFGEN